MPYISTAQSFVFQRVSNTAYGQWWGANDVNYSNRLALYSGAADPSFSIQVHNFSSLDVGAVGGTWTVTSAIKQPLT